MLKISETLLLRVMKMGYTVDFYLYPIVSILLLGIAFIYFPLASWEIVLLYIAGYLLWGLAEYFMHRYTFHHAPLFKQGHDAHHKQTRLEIGTPFFI